MESVKSICIIEDEKDIVETMTAFLEIENYDVISFNSAEEFYEKCPENFKGLYLVDWNLPGEPGIEIISKIRLKDKISPIFMVSAYNKENDIIEGLSRGADDYIIKPFNFSELMVRVKNSLNKYSLVSDQLNNDQLKLLPEAKSFIKDGNTISLTQREFIIFNHLYQNISKPSSREELIGQFSGDDKMTERNIDVHVFSLRKKIKSVDLVVETVWGHGYKLSVIVR